MNRSSRGLLFIALTLALVSVSGALVQAAKTEFPNRPLRYIVAFPPGGASDIVARIAGAALTETLDEQVIIDNWGGASGTIGAEVAAHATSDGYTLFACNIALLASNSSTRRLTASFQLTKKI
jgi:tripartite-type tricarboxylate transporter receptor subunit TctC